MSGMEQLLNSGSWTHFINISARDAPLMSQAAMMRQLSLAARSGKRNFLQYFGGVWVDWLEPDPNAEHAVTYERSPAFPALRASAAMLSSFAGARSPVMNWTIRPNFHCYEDVQAKALYCRGLSRHEAEDRRRIFGDVVRYPRRAAMVCVWPQPLRVAGEVFDDAGVYRLTSARS